MSRRDHRLPRRSFTLWAMLYVMVFVILPFLTLCLVADYGLYRLAKRGLIGCWSLFCLFD
jgi:hypothetical protein